MQQVPTSRLTTGGMGTYVAGSEDGGVPVGHHDVVIVSQAVAAGVIAEALLSLLELLQELKVTWN